jgi:hypothetical protein
MKVTFGHSRRVFHLSIANGLTRVKRLISVILVGEDLTQQQRSVILTDFDLLSQPVIPFDPVSAANPLSK